MSLVRDLVVRESLKYQVFSAETAFVAVRSEPGRTIEEQVIIPNALPYGWSDSFTKAVYMPKMSSRRSANPHYGGSVLEWVGGGGSMDMIMQPDGTMKLDPRDSLSYTRKSSNVIVPKNVPTQSQSRVVPAVSETQSGYQLFEGRPVFSNHESVLFDSSRPEQASKVPRTVVLKKLECIIKDRISQDDTGLYLLLYIDDPAVPRIKIFLRDLAQHQGCRPLNIQRTQGELLKIVLVDPAGEWATKTPMVELVVR